jgi:molybdate transport system ATP-binding protein
MNFIQARFDLQYPGFRLNVDLNLPGHGVSALFGPSGSGKTTLLRLIAGLERTDTGHLSVDGELWQSQATFLPVHDRPIGYVFQDARLFPHLTVRGNLEYGLRRIPSAKQRVSLDDLIELLGIGALLQRKPDRLSGGEQQRVAIARALAVSPRLLMMDEPLASLDQSLKQEILPYLERLHAVLEIPVLYVSHELQEISRLADHLILLDAGRVLAEGKIASLMTRLDLPLAQSNNAEALIEATVAGHDPTYQLTQVRFSGGLLALPLLDLPVGRQVRIRVPARDVSLTLSPQTGTSIINILSATISGIAELGTSQHVAALDIGGTHILSRLTRKSVEMLGLHPGLLVYAQIKGVAILD